jgi:ABC-type uncharacterized transport system auxiliary subunit
MRHYALPAVLILCVWLLAACGAARPSKYYQLTAPIEKNEAADPPPYALTLLVGPLTTSRLYRDDRIVYTSDGQAMGTYEFRHGRNRHRR